MWSVRAVLLTLAFTGASLAQQCGPDYGKCRGSSCCSQWGWCGVSTEYCGTGCQLRYGLCGQLNVPSAPAADAGISTSECGPYNGGKKCASGLCCSQYGWCGSSTDYCGSGCQLGWGSCSSSASSAVANAKSSAKGASSARASSVVRVSSRVISSIKASSSVRAISSAKAASSAKAISSSRVAPSSAKANASSVRASSAKSFAVASVVKSSVGSSGYVSSAKASSVAKASSQGSSLGLLSSSRIASVATASSAAWTSSNSFDSASPSAAQSSKDVSASSIIAPSSAKPSSAQGAASSYDSSSVSKSGSQSSIAPSSVAPWSSASSAFAVSSALAGSSKPSSLASSQSIQGSVSSSSVVAAASSSAAQISSPVSSISASAASAATSSAAQISSPVSSVSASAASASPSSGPRRSLFPNGDPLSDPNAITITSSSGAIQGGIVSVLDAHSGSTCLRITSTPPGGATLEASTSVGLAAGTTYEVSVWIRSVGATGCQVAIVVGTTTVATSSNNIPTTWTLLSGPYTSTSNATPAIRLVVTCPPVLTRRKRQTAPGVDLDDLNVTTNVDASGTSSIASNTASLLASSGSIISSVSYSLLASSSNGFSASAISSLALVSNSVVSVASSAASDIASGTSSFAALSPSSLSANASASLSANVSASLSANLSASSLSANISASIASVSPNSTSPSSSLGISSITASASLPATTATFASFSLSSSASVDSCNPIILDGSFEEAGLSGDGTQSVGNSSDWGPFSLRATDGSDTFQSGPNFAAHNGTYGYSYYYNYFTPSSFVLNYLHPINFCANTVYQLGLWVRNYKTGSSVAQGCQVVAQLNGQGLFSDRQGLFDTTMRYIGGSTSFPVATTASLALSFSCTSRTSAVGFRRTNGIFLDDVEIATATNFVSPLSNIPTTSVADSATLTFPQTASCTPTNFGYAFRTCVTNGELITNPSFEDCDIDSWTFSPNPLTNFDQAKSGVVTEEAHTGSKSLKTVFTPEGGSLGVTMRRTIFTCEQRDFKISYAVKGASSSCRVEHWWTGLLWKTTQLGNSAWQVVEYNIYNPADTMKAKGTGSIGFNFELRITCTTGGEANAVFLDDLSVMQLPYSTNNPPTVPEVAPGPASWVLASISASAAAAASSDVAIQSSSTMASPVVSAAASSLTSSAAGCRATIDDGSFELAGAQGNAADWRPYVPTGASAASLGVSNTYHRDGNYAYVVSTNYNDNDGMINQALNTNYYPKGLKLCANTTYQIGYWTTGYSHNGNVTIGCFAGLYVVDKVILRDVSGPADVGTWRYVGTTFTVSADYPAASMGISFACEKTTVADGYRGYVFDEIAVAPASEFVPPPTPTLSSYTTPVPSNYECAPYLYSRPPMSCVTYGELLSNKGWEDCFNADHDYTYSDADLLDQLWQENAGAKQEDVHSGKFAQKIVILRPNGYWGITFGGFRSCPYRRYRYSFWAKQYDDGNCKVQILWGGVVFAEHTPAANRTPGQGWTQYSGVIDNPFKTAADEKFEIRGTCATGGRANPLYIDDASLVQEAGVTI